MVASVNPGAADRKPTPAPQLSVLTPSFGYARFIGDTIASVAEQSLGERVEHVIADGASTDGTVDVLRAHPDVRWISEPDRGQSDALNRGLSLSRAPIVGWLNADEFYLPGALERAISEFDDPSVDVLYGDAVFVDEAGRFLRRVGQHRFSHRVLNEYGPYISTCSLFVRRSVLSQSPWDVDCRRVMDWELYLRLAAAGASFHYVPYPFGAFRVHEERVTAQPIDDRVRTEHARVRNRYSLPDAGGRRGQLRDFRARSIHRLLKVRDGSFKQDLRARKLRGRDLRWWESEADRGLHAALGAGPITDEL
jgi:glycosyltransferase involved in cell wall biosynthesis